MVKLLTYWGQGVFHRTPTENPVRGTLVTHSFFRNLSTGFDIYLRYLLRGSSWGCFQRLVAYTKIDLSTNEQWRSRFLLGIQIWTDMLSRNKKKIFIASSVIKVAIALFVHHVAKRAFFLISICVVFGALCPHRLPELICKYTSFFRSTLHEVSAAVLLS